MPQNLQNFIQFQKFQLDNLVDFEKCCKTHIFLQKSVPIQPKTSNILPKFCRSAVLSPTVRYGDAFLAVVDLHIRDHLDHPDQPDQPDQPDRFRLYRLRFLQENTFCSIFQNLPDSQTENFEI